MPTYDGDPPHDPDPTCGCDPCVVTARRDDHFAALWSELLPDDPRDLAGLYEPSPRVQARTASAR